MSFETASEAHPKVQSMLKKGDLILVKGSRAVGLDKVVEEIKAL
jgi:UDP-N-acetylmuramyl pentapeptide synthase